MDIQGVEIGADGINRYRRRPDHAAQEEAVHIPVELIDDLIEEDKKHTEHQKEIILATIDNLRKRYTFKEYRNKAKAHFDLETMFDSPFSTVSTDEIKELLFGLRDVVSLTFGMMFGIRMEEYPYLEKKQQYEDAILSCINRRN